jgi:hypothetical protein
MHVLAFCACPGGAVRAQQAPDRGPAHVEEAGIAGEASDAPGEVDETEAENAAERAGEHESTSGPDVAVDEAPETDRRVEDAMASEVAHAPDPGGQGGAAHDAGDEPAVEPDLDEGEDELPLFGARATVDAAVPAPLPGAASELAIDTARYRLVPRPSTESLLTLAPGVFLVNHSGTFHASTMILRGFVAGEGQDLELLVDGMPINEPSNAHGHGYGDLHFVIPEATRSVRVTEGPFSAWQSDFAVAGSAEIELGPAERGITVRGSYGSFDRGRLLLAWAPVRSQRGSFVALDLRGENGFGVQRASQSAVLNGRFETELSRGVRFSIFGAGQMSQFGSAGVVREDDVANARLPCGPARDAQFFCSPDPEQGGASSRALLDAGLSIREPHLASDNHLFAGHRRLRIRENFTGLALDPRGDGLDEQYEVVTVGLRGRTRFSAQFFAQPQVFELGYVVRQDVGTTRLSRLRADGGIPHTAVFDDDLSLTQIGAHVGAELRFTDWLAMRAGLRADVFGLSAREKALPDGDRMGARLPEDTTDAWGLSIAPRGSARVALSPWLTWHTSVGVGTRSSDATALSSGEAAPFARVIASETGLIAEHQEGELHLDARLLGHHTHVDRDLVFDASRGRNVDAGASSRLGASAYVSLGVAEALTGSVSFAWSEAFLLPDRGFALTSATRLPYVPRWVGRADVVGRLPVVIDGETITLGLGAGAGLLGERPLPLGQMSAPVFLLDVQGELAWRDVSLRVAVTNVTDTRWQSAVFRYASHWDPDSVASRVPELHFSAGAPLALDVSLGFRFDETRGPLATPERTPPP